ncbi:uncharacterized protein [Solanum lycopersicum]|uniref:uncharacterized protein n=1 Tax=Solanum lycopersicum TaxID=4081 RepID=UPI003747E409
MGVSRDLQEEYRSAMLYDNLNISCLMVHIKHVEETMDKRKSKDAKRARSFYRGHSKNRLEIQDNPRFKKRVFNQVPYRFRKDRDVKATKTISEKGRSGNSPYENPTCAKCRKGHFGDYLVGTGNYFGCGKSSHEKGGQAQASGSNEAPKKNHFYAIRSRGEQETSPAW